MCQRRVKGFDWQTLTIRRIEAKPVADELWGAGDGPPAPHNSPYAGTAQHTALIEAGINLNLSPTATFSVSYPGQFGDGVEDNAVRGRFAWRF